MFTGLIQQVGSLDRWEQAAGGRRLLVSAAPWAPPLTVGESVAINGACLSIAHCQAGSFACDVLQETLQRTTLGAQGPGSALNLERALRMGDPLGGHLVTGHVDGTGTLLQKKAAGRDWILRVACAPDLLRDLVSKGSIALNGVSLTIVELDARSFSVHIIPLTWAGTNLHTLREGDALNLETDILGKHVRRYLESSPAGLTWDKLRQAGFGI